MKILVGILLGFTIGLLAAAGVMITGLFDVAAVTPPSRFEQKIATFALRRSVARRAPRASNPMAASPEIWRAGLSHYKENCVMCHGAPGVEESEFGQGLNPPAPDLTLPAIQKMSDGELFWIVSNGIRMTGMPAFSPTHKPEEVWKIVAFVRHLPELSDEEEKALGSGADEKGHHRDSGAEASSKEDSSPAPAQTPKK
jgi:mono/diheme cytochrome c family protein